MNKKENRALIERLRPHFVFNTINNICYMLKKDSSKAEKMLYDLALYMRCKISALTEEKPSPFATELKCTNAYIRLEQISLRHLTLEQKIANPPESLNPGAMLEAAERLIKEQVRSTKEPRTLVITDQSGKVEKGIVIMVKETDVWIPL